MTDMQVETPTTDPVETTPTKHTKPWLIPAAAAAAALVVGFGLGSAVASDGTTTEPPTATSGSPGSGADNRDEAEAAGPGEAGFATTAEDWAVDLTVSEKKCFGSAGCNVSVEPTITRIGGELPSSGTIIVRVSISGDESGEIIETYRVNAATGTYDGSPTRMSTTDGGVVPTATVTFAEYRDF